MPGNFDKPNCGALWPTDNEWGTPALPPARLEPARLVAYTDRHATSTAGPGAAVHFVLDDHRFEVVWSKPERDLSVGARSVRRRHRISACTGTCRW
ncbi:hypothetical protein ABZ342_35240 [Amycolatopsis sp. NPDC005961]|uniref:DUF4417 domain-containing protein n=1 Tax=Amycolatopsis sp. NPDC005961 TaxID=3156720 RepID=UPI0033D735B8